MRGVALRVARGRTDEAAGVVDSLDPAELDVVIRTAEAEGLLPLLAAAGGRARRHPDLRKRCEKWTRDAIRRDLAADRLLRGASQLLDRAGIPFLLMKGACFRDLLYPAPWLRAMGDVDLLVRGVDLDRAVRALAEGGYWRRTSYSTRPFSMKFSLERQMEFLGGGLVEVHAGPAYEPYGLRTDIEGVFSRAIRAPRGPAPSWEDHVILVAIHQARTGMLAGVRPFLDLALVVETRTLDWEVLTRRCVSWGCSSALFFCLEAVRCLFGGVVPAHVLARTAPRGGRGALLRALTLRGAGDPIGGLLRAAPIPRDASAAVFDLWRPTLYALLLDRPGPRLQFLAWVVGSRAVDRCVAGLTRSS